MAGVVAAAALALTLVGVLHAAVARVGAPLWRVALDGGSAADVADLGRRSLAHGEAVDAVAFFRAACEMAPWHAGHLAGLVTSLAVSGRCDEARDLLLVAPAPRSRARRGELQAAAVAVAECEAPARVGPIRARNAAPTRVGS